MPLSESGNKADSRAKRGKEKRNSSSRNGNRRKKKKDSPPFPMFIHLPVDLFRQLLSFLWLDELMIMEKALLENHELLTHWNLSLAGTSISDEIDINNKDEYAWVHSHGILIQNLTLGGPAICEFENFDHFWTPALKRLTISHGGNFDLGDIL
jgi:hypothetical protein